MSRAEYIAWKILLRSLMSLNFIFAGVHLAAGSYISAAVGIAAGLTVTVLNDSLNARVAKQQVLKETLLGRYS